MCSIVSHFSKLFKLFVLAAQLKDDRQNINHLPTDTHNVTAFVRALFALIWPEPGLFALWDGESDKEGEEPLHLYKLSGTIQD